VIQEQSNTDQTERRSNLTNEELYLVIHAQQRQISDIIRVQNEMEERLKKWELYFGDKFSGVFAGEVGTVEDANLKPIEIEEKYGIGFASLLRGEEPAGNAPPTPIQDQ
jgi:hypothetical protein